MITSNVLKIFAIITMLIDHIGSYFVANINQDIYIMFRSIGRLAMPIFLYLMVQGFFHTSDIKKYIFRLFCLATLTQIILLGLGIINKAFFPNYYSRLNEYWSVLFSYVLSLILITIIDYKVIIKKFNKYVNFILRILIIIFIIYIYMNVDIEFDMRIPFMCLELFVIEKVFRDSKTGELFSSRKYDKMSKKMLMSIIYITLIGISFVTSLDFSSYHPGYKYSIIFSLIPIILYNGKKGKKSRVIQIVFYCIFPIQHIILYLVAMINSINI